MAEFEGDLCFGIRGPGSGIRDRTGTVHWTPTAQMRYHVARTEPMMMFRLNSPIRLATILGLLTTVGNPTIVIAQTAISPEPRTPPRDASRVTTVSGQLLDARNQPLRDATVLVFPAWVSPTSSHAFPSGSTTAPP